MTKYLVELHLQLMPGKPETAFMWRAMIEAPHGNDAIDLAEAECMSRIRQHFDCTSDSGVPVSVIGRDVWEEIDAPYGEAEPIKAMLSIERLRDRVQLLNGMLQQRGVDALLSEVESLRARKDMNGRLRDAAYQAWVALDAEFHGDC